MSDLEPFKSHYLIPELLVCFWMPVNMTRLGDTISEADIMPSQHHHQKFNRIYLRLNYHFWGRTPKVISQLCANEVAVSFIIPNISHLLSHVFRLMFPSRGTPVRKILTPNTIPLFILSQRRSNHAPDRLIWKEELSMFSSSPFFVLLFDNKD